MNRYPKGICKLTPKAAAQSFAQSRQYLTVTMKLCLIFLFVRAAYSAGIADIISSYAQVAINNGNNHHKNATGILNTTDSDDEPPTDYDDFDDATEAVERGQSSDTMVKYINGFINLLALMYKFSGNPKPKPTAIKISHPRSADESLSKSVNQLAEDRYHPSTETKKFKAEGYPPLKSFTYNTMGSNAAETYGNAGKTSYDSDSAQYMIQNPEEEDTMPDTDKIPMKDYMKQNNVDIRQSYSYEIPQKADDSWNKPAPVYYPWMSKTTSPPATRDESWGDHQQHEKPKIMKKPIESYSWLSKPDTNDWNNVPSKEKPIEMYPWMSHEEPEEHKMKMPPTWTNIDDDADGMVPPPKSKSPPVDSHIYPYPYLSDHDVVYHDDHEEDHGMKDEDRESKRPYTYYHLGRKLWYVPLLFSLYFIVYIASLILKSIARHKVQFPEKLWELNDHDHHHHHGDHSRRNREINQVTDNIYTSIEKVSNKYE